jgi:hypothetical protein
MIAKHQCCESQIFFPRIRYLIFIFHLWIQLRIIFKNAIFEPIFTLSLSIEVPTHIEELNNKIVL